LAEFNELAFSFQFYLAVFGFSFLGARSLLIRRVIYEIFLRDIQVAGKRLQS